MARSMLYSGGSGLTGNTTSGTLNKFLPAPTPAAGPIPSSGTPWAPTPAAPAPAPRIASEAYPIQQNYGQAPQNYSQNYAQPVGGGGYGGGISDGGGGGYGGGGSAAPARPMTYDQFSDDMAATDSTFMDQKSAYANALKKYIAEHQRQYGEGNVQDENGGMWTGTLGRDAKTAVDGIGRNRTMGLTSLGEDFASRGLSNSGMYGDEMTKASQRYADQSTGVKNGLKDARADLDFRKAKYEQENGENGTNIQAARREAFARLAASQGLT